MRARPAVAAVVLAALTLIPLQARSAAAMGGSLCDQAAGGNTAITVIPMADAKGSVKGQICAQLLWDKSSGYSLAYESQTTGLPQLTTLLAKMDASIILDVKGNTFIHFAEIFSDPFGQTPVIDVDTICAGCIAPMNAVPIRVTPPVPPVPMYGVDESQGSSQELAQHLGVIQMVPELGG
jgi:hypothetical protein